MIIEATNFFNFPYLLASSAVSSSRSWRQKHGKTQRVHQAPQAVDLISPSVAHGTEEMSSSTSPAPTILFSNSTRVGGLGSSKPAGSENVWICMNLPQSSKNSCGTAVNYIAIGACEQWLLASNRVGAALASQVKVVSRSGKVDHAAIIVEFNLIGCLATPSISVSGNCEEKIHVLQVVWPAFGLADLQAAMMPVQVSRLELLYGYSSTHPNRGTRNYSAS